MNEKTKVKSNANLCLFEFKTRGCVIKVHIKKKHSEALIIPENDQLTVNKIESNWFDADYWLQHDSIIGESLGRYVTWFIQPAANIDENSSDYIWVLRHYYRGGFVAKITTDQFFYTGIRNTRGFREVELLLCMKELNLPVPRAIGARIVRKGLFYRADLLMEKIAAKDMVAILKAEPITNEQWSRIGRVIAQFHHHGIYHADLNAHNILIDAANKVWLIDFDRCDRRQVNSSWQQKNIQRFKRSLLKEKTIFPSFYFSEQCWEYLIQGYQSAN